MNNYHHHLQKRQVKLAKRLAKQATRSNPDYDFIGVKFLTGPRDRFNWDVILRKDARDLVGRGLATWCDNAKAIRVHETHPDDRFGTMGVGFPKDYSPSYDKIGLEKYPRELVGGLCRTETKPVAHSRAPGWRPLH